MEIEKKNLIIGKGNSRFVGSNGRIDDGARRRVGEPISTRVLAVKLYVGTSVHDDVRHLDWAVSFGLHIIYTENEREVDNEIITIDHDLQHFRLIKHQK